MNHFSDDTPFALVPVLEDPSDKNICFRSNSEKQCGGVGSVTIEVSIASI
jgi:hypothetical protein